MAAHGGAVPDGGAWRSGETAAGVLGETEEPAAACAAAVGGEPVAVFGPDLGR